MFGDKLFMGVGFPTPVSIPDETTCLLIQVPASDEWWALMVGLLYELTLEWNWQQFEGGLDRDVAAAKWQEIFDQAVDLASVSDTCALSVGTPFWDESSADDADDEAPINDQRWYGQVEAAAAFTVGSEELTFVENAFIFVVAGLIAYSGQVGAAIAFVPIAQKFVIKAKTNPLGGFIAFLRDGVEIGRTDTYSPEDGTVDTTIVWPTEEGLLESEPPVLWVMLTDQANPAVEGAPSMSIVRDQLSASQVTPQNIRWNEECDCVQQTPDDGETWVDTPQNDPRHGDGFRMPPRGGTNPQCDAAENMKAHIQATFDAIIGSSNALQAASAVFGVFSLFFFEFGIIIDLILAVVTAIFSVGTSTLESALTEDVYDQLLCILYCNISADGTVTASQYDDIYAAVDTAPAPMAGVAATVIKQLLGTWGEVELSNAGAKGEETGDCDDCACAWCYTFDFTASDGGWYASRPNPSYSAVAGSYSSGVGWIAIDTTVLGDGERSVCIQVSCPGATIIEFSGIYEFVDGNVGVNNGELCHDGDIDTRGTHLAYFGDGSSGSKTWAWTGTQSADTLTAYIDCFYAHPASTPSGSVTVTSITLRGIGDNPFGDDNC